MTTSLKAFDALAAGKRGNRGTPVPQLPLAQIAPMAGQPRSHFDPAALAELAESIRAHGVIQPILVIARKEAAPEDPVRYTIVCGERRFQAAKSAGLTAIPALVRDYDDDEAAVLALLENLQREDLTPLEEGEYLLALKSRYDFTEEELGERLGKSRDYVHNRTRLLNLHPDLIAVWKNPEAGPVFQRFTPSHAIWINQLPDAESRAALVEATLKDELTVAEVRRRLERAKEIKGAEPRIGEEAARKLSAAALAGAPEAELRMRLAASLKRTEAGAPEAPAAGRPALPAAAVAAGDLETTRLIGAHPGGALPYAELRAALERDLKWLKRLEKRVLKAET